MTFSRGMATSYDAKYREEIRQLRMGMTPDQVRSVMGQAPTGSNRLSSADFELEHWYYGSWQLGFTNGQLDSKRHF